MCYEVYYIGQDACAKIECNQRIFFLYNPNRYVLQWLIIGLYWSLVMIIYETEGKMHNWFR